MTYVLARFRRGPMRRRVVANPAGARPAERAEGLPRMRIRHLTGAVVAVLLAGAGALTVQSNANARPSGASSAAARTAAFFAALERQDEDALRGLFAPSVRWENPMAISGNNDDNRTPLTGRDAVLDNFRSLQSLITTVRFTDLRITVANGGRTSVAEVRGDMTTAAGQPYRNVYVFRFDWLGGRIVAGAEYANPMTICVTFGPPGCPAATT